MVYHQPDTCKCRTPYAQSRLFFRCLHFLSEEVHKKVYITENIPSKVASKGYIYRKLQDVQFVHALGRKKLRSLQEQTFAQNKAIQVDMQAFWNLVKTSGVAGYPADYIDDIDKDCQVWAIDPGVCDIITTVDTSGRQRTTSVNEYYHLCGFNDHENKYFPPAPADHTEAPLKTIIDFGDEDLKTKCSKNMMYMLDEYLTSQVCNESKKINLENLVNSNLKRRVYTILQCQETTCNIVWNRNIMATQNLLGILFSARNNNQRRDVFVCQPKTNHGHQYSSV
ncbi:hypothetical protein PHYBLDRAFT_145444 [Phycomyces blakesleeanus NRRL 1555(-)]|uniref:Uncharacterized protein n=1 Tax=Phycomyces blakesleeanus (strain ATCC 8743b / DSM 1359 / FGSC 10004 / NBRC 33097 / NRRL 1555) TaxID=763407 RepID=A0A163DX90_PHYB8|nr:hypothetical protein PHYBLDRAFT_145444 [Phycomyces blakesleeanus NRRL 1555(-)]OAD73980.1 hypothetical protein PHYBLDRAFT_145444 [Phycomyces blakesleeanus NRRL 1555(-)]|eukprot:XP_018292020.1 hypothetical protein PHYBLDRAFT_145444 [Phycomyces blakesleeanus NRRL 1555(-)]